MKADKTLKTLLEVMVAALVDNEQAVKISATVSEGGIILFEVDVAKEDVGKIIGKSGKTAGALRHVLGAASSKLGVRSIMDIPDKKNE